MNIKAKFIVLLLLVALTYSEASSQITSEKVAALRESIERLDKQEGEILGRLDSFREELIAKGGGDATLQSEILTLERELYALRAQRQKSTERLLSISGIGESVEPKGSVKLTERAEQRGVAKFSDSDIAKNLLSKEELHALVRGEYNDYLAARKVRGYIANYREMNGLYEDYIKVDNEREALRIVDKFNSLATINDSLALELVTSWDLCYGDKLYAYNLILELSSRSDLLDRGDEICRRSLPAPEAGWVSDELELYINQKSQMLSYEQMMSDALNLPDMSDSLSGAITLLAADQCEYPPLTIKERSFILEEPIHFSSTEYYTSKNPIPKCTIYERGVNYRLSVGAFTSKQLPSLFRGAYPVAYSVIDGKYQYFIGGFTSMEDAEQGKAQLLKRGFRRPEIVMWRDGMMRNLARDPLPAAIGHRVEVSGLPELTEQIEATIKQVAPRCNVVRVASDRYVLGILDDRASADNLARLISECSDKVVVRVIDIIPE